MTSGGELQVSGSVSINPVGSLKATVEDIVVAVSDIGNCTFGARCTAASGSECSTVVYDTPGEITVFTTGVAIRCGSTCDDDDVVPNVLQTGPCHCTCGKDSSTISSNFDFGSLSASFTIGTSTNSVTASYTPPGGSAISVGGSVTKQANGDWELCIDVPVWRLASAGSASSGFQSFLDGFDLGFGSSYATVFGKTSGTQSFCID